MGRSSELLSLSKAMGRFRNFETPSPEVPSVDWNPNGPIGLILSGPLVDEGWYQRFGRGSKEKRASGSRVIPGHAGRRATFFMGCKLDIERGAGMLRISRSVASLGFWVEAFLRGPRRHWWDVLGSLEGSFAEKLDRVGVRCRSRRIGLDTAKETVNVA